MRRVTQSVAVPNRTRLTLPGGRDAEGGGQVCFAGARWPEQDDVAVLGRYAPEARAWIGVRATGWWPKSKSSSVLTAEKAAARTRSRALRAADLAFQDCGQVALVGPSGVAGVVTAYDMGILG